MREPLTQPLEDLIATQNMEAAQSPAPLAVSVPAPVTAGNATDWPNIFKHDLAHWEAAARHMFVKLPRHEWGRFVNWLAEEVGVI